MKTSQVLRKALSLFGENGERWYGDTNKSCDKFCTTLAVAEVSRGEDEYDALDVLKTVFNTTQLDPIWHWNDHPDRTFPQVKEKYLEAIALAEQDEKNGE